VGDDDLAGYFRDPLPHDLLSLCAGELLGRGAGRTVCVFAPDPTLVIKFETESQSFQNQWEWETWLRVQDTPHVARWFAPCVSISSFGSVMLMKRTEPAPEKAYPDRIPAFMADLKRPNWGLLKGKLVCHDYGRHLLMEYGTTTRMQKAEWW